ncbi:MAG: arginine--tRNA ligase [Sphaerimonospora mesophila]
MNQYAAIVAHVIQRLFAIEVEVTLSRPDPKFGDFATNVALRLAGTIGKPPRDIAEMIAVELRTNDIFSEVQIAGPGFINLSIAAMNLNNNLDEQCNSEKPFGENNDGQGKTVVVEYPSPNMAKPYSVGHLRSGNQGWAARNLLKATGWQVITDDHLGDYGAPFGIWVVGFKKFSSEQQLAEGGVYELGRVYIETRQAMKEEAERGEHGLADEAQAWLLKLENGDDEAVKLSEKFNTISLEHIHTVMARLGISTDYEYGEKFFAPFGKKCVQDLLTRGIATQNDDGSVIVDLSDQGIETPLLIQKSNGAALYATTDLATILWREEHWQPTKVVYCVGAEQKFYFEQLAALAKKLGIETELYHLWFGTIDQMTEDGKREKMSSRKGVVLMEELLDAAEKTARANAKSADMTDEDIRKIAVGAIKFSDFAADRRTGMLFNWETMFSLTGFSGPYVQYAAVRVNKILRDNDWDDESIEQTIINSYNYEPEKALLLKLLEYPETVAVAARELEPHRIASYAYELARELNRYYEQTPVATAEVPDDIKQARLGVLGKVAAVFGHSLGILGIEIPSRM